MEIDTAIEEATPSTQVAEPIGTDEQANVQSGAIQVRFEKDLSITRMWNQAS